MAKSIDELNNDIASLSKQLEALTNTKAPEFKITGINDAITAVNTLNAAIKTAQNQAASLNSGFGNIYQTLVDIVAELKATNNSANLFAKSFVSIQNSAQKLYLHQAGINRLSSDELKSIKSRVEANQEIAKLQAKSIYDATKNLLLDKNGKELNTGNLSLRLRSLVAQNKITEAQSAAIRGYKTNFEIIKDTVDLLGEEVKLTEEQEKQLRKSLGIAGALLGAFGKIPILGESAAKAYGKIAYEAEKIQAATGKAPSRMQNLSKAAKETGKILKEKLTDPLFLIGGAINMLVKGFLEADKSTAQLQKNLSISQGEARDINRSFSATALASDSLAVNSRTMAAYVGATQEKMGSIGKISNETAETFARLTRAAGLTENAAAGLTVQSDAFGKNQKENYTTLLQTSHQVSQQYKTHISERAVLEDVGKASSYTLAQFKGSTKALTEGVAKAKALGTSLEVVNKIAGSLLNFQQSIEDELAAEVLSGRQLNLEQARYYALTNQQSKLMDELTTQVGTYSDFMSQTALSQDAQAKALGMTSTELSDILLKEQYRNATAADIANISDEDLRKRVETLTVQEKLQLAMDRFSATMADFVSGPLGQFLTSSTGILTVFTLLGGSIILRAITGFAALGTIFRSLRAASLGIAIGKAYGAAMSSPQSFLTGGLAGLAIGGVLAGVITAAVMADDLFSEGGYGKRTLITSEGAFKLNDKDNIIATTNPINVNDMISGPKSSINPLPQRNAPQPQQVKSDISITPGNTKISLNLNGTVVGNVNATQDYSVGKNVKAFGGNFDYSAGFTS